MSRSVECPAVLLPTVKGSEVANHPAFARDERWSDVYPMYASRVATLDVPVVPKLHTRTLQALAGEGRLDMHSWHGDRDGYKAIADSGHIRAATLEERAKAFCGTTHCRAGWALHLAGPQGYALEKELGIPYVAAMLIIMASCPFLKALPDFYCCEPDALSDIEAASFLEDFQ